MPLDSVLGHFFFLFFSDLGFNLENKLISYADDKLYSSVHSPSNKDEVPASLNMVLTMTTFWCQDWDKKLNANETRSISVPSVGLAP